MAQLVRTVNDVIVNALYLIGELGVDETPDAYMLSTGLDLVNELIDKLSSDSIYIPYLTTIHSVFTVGKGTYSISDMIPANITADRVVDLSFANYEVPASGSIPEPFSSDYYTNYQINSQLILPDTGAFPTGTPVVVSVTNNGTLSSPLLPNITYYVINVDINHLLLATTLANAQAGIYITLTSNGTGTGTQIITSQNDFPVPELITPALIYPLRIINKAQYWNVVRQNNLFARPGFIFLDKQPQESFITVYPIPDQPYKYSIQVKSMINQLGNQDTLGELPPFYYGFFKYAIARDFSQYYPSSNWMPQSEDKYQDYYNILKNSNETDLTIRPSVVLTAPEPFYWPNILSY
jgi:hypothetical protein